MMAMSIEALEKKKYNEHRNRPEKYRTQLSQFRRAVYRLQHKNLNFAMANDASTKVVLTLSLR